MTSSFRQKYLEALKTFDDWVIVSEWAKRFGEMYPDLLEKANREAENQANDTTGLREIAARISSIISQGGYEDKIEIDTSERPRKVRYMPEEKRAAHETLEIEEDVAPLKRDELIKQALETMTPHEKYRSSEFEDIAKKLKSYFGLSFEVDHAEALLNPVNPGRHHPDNFQIILKEHNSKKNNKNWARFTIDEQVEYLRMAIKLQKLVATRFDEELDENVLCSIEARLKSIY